jgi:hypothetical protein
MNSKRQKVLKGTVYVNQTGVINGTTRAVKGVIATFNFLEGERASLHETTKVLSPTPPEIDRQAYEDLGLSNQEFEKIVAPVVPPKRQS